MAGRLARHVGQAAWCSFAGVIWGRCFDPDEGARLGDLPLLAAIAVWNAYPYLKRRFGSRGRGFANSNGCWLLTLTRMEVDTVTSSVA